MTKEEVLISGIEYKIRRLIQLNSELQRENDKLKQDVFSLSELVKELTESLKKAENKIVKLSLANTLEYNVGVEEGKEKLKELIEEIDKCINVLSD